MRIFENANNRDITMVGWLIYQLQHNVSKVHSLTFLFCAAPNESVLRLKMKFNLSLSLASLIILFGANSNKVFYLEQIATNCTTEKSRKHVIAKDEVVQLYIAYSR